MKISLLNTHYEYLNQPNNKLVKSNLNYNRILYILSFFAKKYKSNKHSNINFSSSYWKKFYKNSHDIIKILVEDDIIKLEKDYVYDYTMSGAGKVKEYSVSKISNEYKDDYITIEIKDKKIEKQLKKIKLDYSLNTTSTYNFINNLHSEDKKLNNTLSTLKNKHNKLKETKKRNYTSFSNISKEDRKNLLLKEKNNDKLHQLHEFDVKNEALLFNIYLKHKNLKAILNKDKKNITQCNKNYNFNIENDEMLIKNNYTNKTYSKKIHTAGLIEEITCFHELVSKGKGYEIFLDVNLKIDKQYEYISKQRNILRKKNKLKNTREESKSYFMTLLNPEKTVKDRFKDDSFKLFELLFPNLAIYWKWYDTYFLFIFKTQNDFVIELERKWRNETYKDLSKANLKCDVHDLHDAFYGAECDKGKINRICKKNIKKYKI